MKDGAVALNGEGVKAISGGLNGFSHLLHPR